jgi:hypothetical protein
MKRFSYEISSDYEEIYDDFSQEFNTNIEYEALDNDALIFDQQSLEKLQEIVTQSIEESDAELFESDDEFFQSNKEEIFEEFEYLIPHTASCNIKTHCVIIDNDNDQNIIQRCIKSGDCYLKELSGA